MSVVPSVRHLHIVTILQMDATGAGHNGHGDESEKHCCRMASDATLHLVRGGTRVGKLPTKLAPAANFSFGTYVTRLISAPLNPTPSAGSSASRLQQCSCRTSRERRRRTRLLVGISWRENSVLHHATSRADHSKNAGTRLGGLRPSATTLV